MGCRAGVASGDLRPGRPLTETGAPCSPPKLIARSDLLCIFPRHAAPARREAVPHQQEEDLGANA
ncbi:MAG: hypothetical protein Kow0097_09540 [Candidatus Bipolaricaulota bacterium]